MNIPELDKLVADLSAKMGEKIGPLIAEMIAQKMREAGMDRVDRRFGRFPLTGETNPNLTMPDRAKLWLRAVLFGSDPADDIVRKALSEASDPAGGYLVPTEYRAELIKRLPELSDLFPYVRVVPVNTDAGNYPKLSTDVSITWGRAENDAITETDPTFTQLSWTVRNMSAITYMSRELVADSNPSIVQTITDLFTEAVAAERDKVIAIGNASNSEPEGIYSASGLSSVAVDGALTYAKLCEIQYTLKRKYQKNARWVMNSTNLRRIHALVDSNGQPILRDAPIKGESPSILGKSFSIQDDLPSSVILFGDLSQYFWFDRQRMVIESTTTGGDTFKKHQVAIKVVERCDGKLALAEAFVKGTGIA